MPAGLRPDRDLRRCTVPALLIERARFEPQRIALRAKRRGLYVQRSWRELALQVARVARGLEALGIAPGARMAIMGDACEEWAVADLACQCLGGISYGIYPTAATTELEYQMNDGGATVFVAENQEYVDRLLAVADRLPDVRAIVVIDPTALFAYDDARLIEFDSLGRPGNAAVDLDWLAERAARVQPDDPAFIVYTSGTTGHPKGALVSHGRHLAGTFNLVQHYPLLAQPDLRTVVYLPMCHVLGRDIAITLPLLSGLVPHYGESVEDLGATLFEVAPAVLFTVPRYLQKFASQILIGAANTTPLKRRVFDLSLQFGRRHARRRWNSACGLFDHLLYAVARRAGFVPVLNKLGFDCLQLVISGGAPLPAETMTFWQMLGVNVCEIYGQTETAGAIISGQPSPFPQPGNVGTVAAGIELQLSTRPDSLGEILVRSDYRFDGYWNKPEPSADSFDGDWLRTGDVGRFNGDRLQLIDRARDFIVTAGGKTLSPTHIESAMRGSPYIGEIIVFGHARKFVSALVEIDYDAVADWARARNLAYAGFTSLTEHPQVLQLIQAEIEAANRQLARVERIKAFRILPKALDPEEEGEPVTPTRKVKRKQMYERFGALVESMYDASEEALLHKAVGD